MPVFCVLTMEIFKGVISCVTNEGVRVHGAAHQEFVCEVVDELASVRYNENHFQTCACVFYAINLSNVKYIVSSLFVYRRV